MFYLLLFIRILENLVKLVLISLPLQILGIFLVPIGILLSKNNKFPVWLKYFDNADVWLDRDTSTYKAVINQGIIYQWYWLAIRNPCNYFGYSVLGFQYNPSLIIPQIPNFTVGDGQGSTPGYYYQEIIVNNSTYYEYYLIHKWSSTKCLRARLGWKIGNPGSNQIGNWVEAVCVFQPYKDYSGT